MVKAQNQKYRALSKNRTHEYANHYIRWGVQNNIYIYFSHYICLILKTKLLLFAKISLVFVWVKGMHRLIGL